MQINDAQHEWSLLKLVTEIDDRYPAFFAGYVYLWSILFHNITTRRLTFKLFLQDTRKLDDFFVSYFVAFTLCYNSLQFLYMLSGFLDMFSLIISSEGYILPPPPSSVKWAVRMRNNKWLKSLRYFPTIMVVKTMRAAAKTS